MADQIEHKDLETDRGLPRSVSPYRAGFSCSCPNCGSSPLFERGLELRENCEACGFDLSAADTGDGAQVFVILILGAICAILGFILTGAGVPPVGIIAILGVVIIVGSYWMLRVFKATLVALQFHHDAHEGRTEDED